MSDVRFHMLWNSTLMSQSKHCLLKCNCCAVFADGQILGWLYT